MKTEQKVVKKTINRRGFLMLLGIGGTVAVGVKLGLPWVQRKVATWVEESGGPPAEIDASPIVWFQIASDNQVTLFIPKVEMGQGVHTSLAQIAAEDLEINWEDLVVSQIGTGKGLDDSFGTSGSSTISSLYQPLREAGALLKEMLHREAALQLKTEVDQLQPNEGKFVGESSSITYGKVVANKVGEWELPDEIPLLKPKNKFRFIGKAIPRVDLYDKVQGKATYGYDLRADDMLYGAILRPPTFNATLLNILNLSAIKAMSGVLAVVYDQDFFGVVAENRDQAYAAILSTESEWEEDYLWEQGEIESLVTVGEGKSVVIQKEGNTTKALSGDERAYHAEYRSPMGYHAHLEPQAALADVREDQAIIKVSTQAPVRIQGLVAKAIGLKDKQVEVQPVYLGGGFGRKIDESAPVEAARLSAAVGHPVHIGWNRTEDFLSGFTRPPVHNRLSSIVNEDGLIETLEHQQASGEVAFAFFPDIARVVMGADFGAWRGAYLHYSAMNKKTTTWLADLPIPTGWWRGLGVLPNVFAVESFIDELAVMAGIDPLEFRLQNLPDTELGNRARNVLKIAAEMASWGNSESGIGKGIAWSTDVNTLVAEVAEVYLDDQKIMIRKVFTAVDPGLVISTDGAKAQILGAITMGLSAVLKEEVTIKAGQFEQTNFHTYPLLTMREAPDIEIELISQGDVPYGLGEPPIGPIGAAVANAVFDLTGQRLRELPLKLVE